MTQLQLLHKLVHSLNKGEKKQFTQQVEKQQYKQDKYFYMLYKILEQQVDFDEPLITELYKAESKKKDLVDDKNYLQEQLLRCLSISSSEDNLEIYILHLIIKIRSLENKGHIELALKCIKQAIKLCEETENFILLLRCLNIEQSFYPYLHENTDKTIDAQNKYNETLQALLLMNQMDLLVLKVSKIYENNTKKGIHDSKEDMLSLLEELPDFAKLQYHRQKASYYHIHFAAYYQLGDYATSYKNICLALEEMNRNIYFAYEDKWMYITTHINAAHNAFKLNLQKDVDVHFNAIDQWVKHPLFSNNSSFLVEVQKLRISHQLIIYLFQKNYIQIAQLEEEAVKLFNNSYTSTYFTKPRNMNICFAMAAISNGNYEKAYYWAMEETNTPNSRNYETYTLICYFVKLIYFIEAHSLDAFDNEYLSATRYIRGKASFSSMDKNIFKLLDKIKSSPDKASARKQILKNKQQFDSIKDNYIFHFVIEWFEKY